LRHSIIGAKVFFLFPSATFLIFHSCVAPLIDIIGLPFEKLWVITRKA